jgi:CheY-like chemotaxis protein/HPt (histidine-containing phosphotransfer) domain-containing protein/anti-sigma regulatory factor (Ser/Thr protein kinase)
LSSRQREYLSLILKSADSLLGLINDILDFSKIEAGHLDLEKIPFQLREVLGDTLQTLALRADEKNLELTFRIPAEIPDRLLGDPLRLRQVIVNLVGNAIKFTSSGEVVVDLSLESVDDPAAIRFAVRDTGIGISEAQQQRVFEAFGQADSSTTRQFGGTGLGLSIAGQLVEMMGGELAVSSEVGKGSTFYFTANFPLPAGPEPAALTPQALRGLRVLVVDDNATNRMILEELLHSWGMSVDAVEGGADALAALAAAADDDCPYSIAILDLMMPQMDGFELAARIRERFDRKTLRLLMLTSASRARVEDLREHLSISRVLIKPTKHADLQQAVTDALAGSAEADITEKPALTKTRAPRSVLLVEDNPVNRRVATEVLQKRGHRIATAVNGREAVELTATQDFDVILMDVHMPVMDGLTATRIIREGEHGSGAHLPIIALTAGATVEDRENSLSAGMDSFLSKPFRAVDLVEAVEEIDASSVALAPVDQLPAQALAADEVQCLDWDGALRNLESDRAFLCELADMFLAQYPGMLEALKGSVAAGSSDKLQRSAHALKGSAQVVGGLAVAATARELETLGRDGSVALAGPVLAALETQLEGLKEALRAALDAH